MTTTTEGGNTMKSTIAAVLAALVAAGAATAATTGAPPVSALWAKLKTVEIQARSQQNWNRSTKGQLEVLAGENARLRTDLDAQTLRFTCYVSLQSDVNTAFYNAFQNIFQQPAGSLHVDDGGACAKLGVKREASGEVTARSASEALAQMTR